METLEKKSITDKIIDGLKNALVEIEDLRVQAALGKAEAKDLYEDSKKKFNHFIHEAKIKLNGVKEKTGENADKLKGFFEHLQVQLALGKAETRDAFEEQSKKISHALHELEHNIRKNDKANEYYTKLLMEIEQFKIKLAILKLRYALKKMEAQQELDGKKAEFLKHLAEVKTRLMYKEEKERHRWEHFQDEMAEAFKRLKNVFA